MRRLLLLACFFGGSSLFPAVPLTLPEPACRLTVTDFSERLETDRLWRVLFDGCIQFEGDPPRGFALDEQVPRDCSLQLSHSLDHAVKLQFRVYENKGPTGYSDELWNDLLEAALASLPGEYSGGIMARFELGPGTGTPILGHISMEARLSLTAEESGRTYFYRICAVPSRSGDHVLLVGLFCESDQFSVVNRSVEAFLRSLYEPSG